MTAACVLIFQTVHVVSIDAVTIRCGSIEFQANDVSGANWVDDWPLDCCPELVSLRICD